MNPTIPNNRGTSSRVNRTRCASVTVDSPNCAGSRSVVVILARAYPGEGSRTKRKSVDA